MAPTCFYYQVDLFKQLAQHPRIDLTVYFCSTEAIDSREIRAMYSTENSWGIEQTLLQGYRNTFLRNFSPWPSYLKSFYGLLNLGIVRELHRNRPDAIVLMSWMNPTWWLAICASILYRVPIFYMTDANVQTERTTRLLKKVLKRFSLGKILFRFTSGFLTAGTNNEQLYLHYGVPAHKLFPFSYSWGYDKLIESAEQMRPQRQQLRTEMGISDQDNVILFCGRFSQEKDILLLLQAYCNLATPNTVLLLAGDGPLRWKVEEFVREHRIDSVRLMGFRDRTDIGKYYTVADLFVLPSMRDTWGIVVAEAMCFALPIVVSTNVGSGVDLVTDGRNGYRFQAGDIDSLTESLERILSLTKEEKGLLGSQSTAIIKDWVGRNVANLLDTYLDTVYGRRTGKRDHRRDAA